MSITLTSNVWLFDAPIESVRLTYIVYFPARSEVTGLMVYIRELELKVMNDGRTDCDFSNVEKVIGKFSSSITPGNTYSLYSSLLTSIVVGSAETK